MKKYNIKTVWDYINGEYIENIDVLEEDYNFMIDVIRITKDKSTFYMCSDEIKNNYDFIKQIIEIFKEDKKFITTVVEDYLSKLDEQDLRYQELIFIMCNIMTNRDDSYESLKYHMIRTSIYSYHKALIETIQENENEEIHRVSGLGFIYILSSDINSCKVIVDYFAKTFVDELFYENNPYTIEELSHKHFKNKEKLQKYGLKNFIINYIYQYDSYLSNYIHTNMNLILHIEKDLKNSIDNWDNYIKRIEERKDNIFEQEAEKIIEEHNVIYNLTEICFHIRKEGYQVPKCMMDVTLQKDFLDEKIFLNEEICLNKIRKLSKEIYSSDVIEETPSEIIQDKKRVLKPNSKKDQN